TTLAALAGVQAKAYEVSTCSAVGLVPCLSPVPTLSTLRSPKLATPLEAVTALVPLRVAPLALFRATVTWVAESSTVLFWASRMRAEERRVGEVCWDARGWVVRTTWAASAGW